MNNRSTFQHQSQHRSRSWQLVTPEEWLETPPAPSNYWAGGNLIEIWKFKKQYKQLVFKYHPIAAVYDYSSAAGDLFAQMKSHKNPVGAAEAMTDAIDKLPHLVTEKLLARPVKSTLYTQSCSENILYGSMDH